MHLLTFMEKQLYRHSHSYCRLLTTQNPMPHTIGRINQWKNRDLIVGIAKANFLSSAPTQDLIAGGLAIAIRNEGEQYIFTHT